jgi:hypothetical protein
MKNSSCLTDFHHGWLIEIVPCEQGFQATCYSPCRKRFVLQEPGSSLDVLYVAKQAIDHQVACSSLSGVLRELYENGQLSFEEWSALHHSLTQIAQKR